MVDAPENIPEDSSPTAGDNVPDPKILQAKKFELKKRLDSLLDAMNKEYAVVLRGSQVLIMRYWIGEDGKSKLLLLSKRDFLIWHENNRFWLEDDDGKKKPVYIAKNWMEWRGRKGYEDIYFEPEGKKYALRFNLWRGFAFEASPDGKFNLFIDHIRENICQNDEKIFEWVMAWLDDLFQHPGHKPGTAIVLRGKMGIGKGVFAHHIGALLGLHYMSITQPSQLTGKFNGHMMDKVLMFVDEGWWSDERGGMGTLNALITEPQIAAEMKGKDTIYIENFTRFIIAANADRIVQTGLKDERRMGMLDVGEAHCQDKPYFIAIKEQMTNRSEKTGKIINEALPENAGYMALLHHLRTMSYDETLPRTIPQTQALEDHRLYSMPDEVKWLQECLIFCKIGNFEIRDGLNNDIETDKFYEAYLKYCDRMKLRPLAVNVLPRKLKQFIELNRRKKSATFNSGYEYQLKDIEALRRDFESGLGQKIDW